LIRPFLIRLSSRHLSFYGRPRLYRRRRFFRFSRGKVYNDREDDIKYKSLKFAFSRWIDVVYGIIPHICIQIDLILIPNRVYLQEPSQRW